MALATQPPGFLEGRKKYSVLGDFDEFAEKLAEVTPPPPRPEPDTVDNSDPSEFPTDVWEAATISPDRGAAIIKAYREVRSVRCVSHSFANIHGPGPESSM